MASHGVTWLQLQYVPTAVAAAAVSQALIVVRVVVIVFIRTALA
jgi:hypothetical protein